MSAGRPLSFCVTQLPSWHSQHRGYLFLLLECVALGSLVTSRCCSAKRILAAETSLGIERGQVSPLRRQDSPKSSSQWLWEGRSGGTGHTRVRCFSVHSGFDKADVQALHGHVTVQVPKTGPESLLLCSGHAFPTAHLLPNSIHPDPTHSLRSGTRWTISDESGF